MQPSDLDIAVRRTVRARNVFSWRLTLVLKAYAATGLIVAIIASGYLVFQQLGIRLDRGSQAALMAAISGLTAAVLSWGVLFVRRELFQRRADRMNEYLLVGRFIHAWAAFEETARSLVEGEAEASNLSVRSVLEALKRRRLLQPTDLIRIEGLLQLRNAVVHTGVQIPPEEIENGYQMLFHYAEELAKAQPQTFVA